MAKNMFAPPSSEELMEDLFAPPSDQELNEPPMFSAKGTMKGITNALPTAGAVVGGVLAAPIAPPFGSIGGATAGGIAGESIKQFLDHYLLDEEAPTRPKFYADLIDSGVQQGLGEMTGAMIVPAAGAIKNGAKSVASSASKIPKKVMEVYAERGPRISKIPDDLQAVGDEIREAGQKGIKSYKSVQNSHIDLALQEHGDNILDMSSVLKTIEENIAKLNPKINGDMIRKLQKQADMIKDVGVQERDKIMMSVRDAYDIQKKLQSLAEYLQPGQVFKKKDFVDITFERAASRARQAVNATSPEIARANSKLAQVRRMDKSMTNKNLILPERPTASLVGAGSGENATAAAQLGKLDRVVGTNMLPQAEDLAAAQTFNKAPLFPPLKTGASLMPLAIGGAAGGSFGIPDFLNGDYESGLGKLAAGATLGSFGSPLAIKGAINASRMVSQSKLLPLGTKEMMRQVPRALQQFGKEKTFEGVNASNTIKLQSAEEAQVFENEIKNNPELTPTQKAKNLNLLRKHGRINIGQ